MALASTLTQTLGPFAFFFGVMGLFIFLAWRYHLESMRRHHLRIARARTDFEGPAAFNVNPNPLPPSYPVAVLHRHPAREADDVGECARSIRRSSAASGRSLSPGALSTDSESSTASVVSLPPPAYVWHDPDSLPEYEQVDLRAERQRLIPVNQDERTEAHRAETEYMGHYTYLTRRERVAEAQAELLAWDSGRETL